jgi:hypothetical protein
LFNGRTPVAGPAHQGYTVEDGVLVCGQKATGGYSPPMSTPTSHFADFKLSRAAKRRLRRSKAISYAEWKFRSWTTPRRSTNRSSWQTRLGVRHRAGQARHRSPGEWNLKILARGRHITVILNGATIVDADLDAATARARDGKPHPGLAGPAISAFWAGAEFDNIRKDLRQRFAVEVTAC